MPQEKGHTSETRLPAKLAVGSLCQIPSNCAMHATAKPSQPTHAEGQPTSTHGHGPASTHREEAMIVGKRHAALFKQFLLSFTPEFLSIIDLWNIFLAPAQTQWVGAGTTLLTVATAYLSMRATPLGRTQQMAHGLLQDFAASGVRKFPASNPYAP